MRKKLYIFGIGLAFIAGGLFLTNTLQGAVSGGQGDPVVTRSYVDMRINEALQHVQAGDVFTPVFVSAGNIVLAAEGTEIILRSGTATAHVPGPDGIVNITSGQDMPHGAAISRNNLLIIPREDGRGIAATTDAWFIIKGGYTITTP